MNFIMCTSDQGQERYLRGVLPAAVALGWQPAASPAQGLQQPGEQPTEVQAD